MTLATVDADGEPDARMVLLKGVDVEGFRFFTNYESAKGAQLEAGAGAALVVYWRELDRQVRVRGTVERLGASGVGRLLRDSPARLAARRLGVAADRGRSESARSSTIACAKPRPRFGEGEVPRPAALGRLPLRPRTIEFWQGQVGRLHDRFRYARGGDGWAIERLAP